MREHSGAFAPGWISVNTAEAIAAVGVFIASIGGFVALYNARKAVQWKRAELASSFLEALASNPNLVFAIRSLEWNGGRLVVPESLRPLLHDGRSWIEHDPDILEAAMDTKLTLKDMNADERMQLYRMALDDLLSWLALVSSALKRKLFQADDIEGIAYYVGQIQTVGFLEGFIRKFGYRESTDYLRSVSAGAIAQHRDGRGLRSGQKASESAGRKKPDGERSAEG